ncbi:MAG: FixH family protein [Granulosicoccus sp.]|nr:FixH family protein [Granulosicoccus sp.]
MTSNPNSTYDKTSVVTGSELKVNTSTDMDLSAKSPWYYNPMMLLVVGIPLLSVVVSFSFLTIAVKTFDGVVVDDYYRQGNEINRLLQRDENARRIGLEADLSFGRDAVLVDLQANDIQNWPSEVNLGILHPTQNGYDISVILRTTSPDHVLQGTTHQYQGYAPDFQKGEWILQLSTSEWRLQRRELTSSTGKITLKHGY